jgi:hypothetical protein
MARTPHPPSSPVDLARSTALAGGEKPAAPSNIIHIPSRGETTIERQYREQGRRFPDEPNYAGITRTAEHLTGSRPTTFERVADAFNNDRAFFFCIGAYAGCLVTVALAYCWSVVL